MKVRIKNPGLKYYVKCIILFFFLYEIAFVGIPTIFSTRKLMFIVLAMVYVYKRCSSGVRKSPFNTRESKQAFYLEVAITVFATVWVVCRAIMNSNFTSRAIIGNGVYLILFGLLAGVFIFYLFRSKEELLKAIIIVSVWQSVFVFIEGASYKVKEVLAEVVFNDSILYTTTNRATGLGAAGSWLSVLLFFGVFAAGYFILKEKEAAKNWISILIILTAQFLTGKTGIFLDLIVIIYVLWKKSRHFRVISIKTLKSLFSIAMVGMIGLAVLRFSGSALVDELVEESITRLFASHAYITDSGGGFFGAFFGMKIPPLSIDSVLGYGMSDGEIAPGLIARHDSGYIRRYTSDGLFMAIIEYSCAFYLFSTLCKRIPQKETREYMHLLIPLVFLIEIKEAYFYQYVIFALLISIFLLSSREAEDCRKFYMGRNVEVEYDF